MPSPLGRQEMHSSAAAAWRLQRAHTIRMQAAWVLAVLSTFFVPGDLDFQNGRRPVQIVGQSACKISSFSAAEKSVTVQTKKTNT